MSKPESFDIFASLQRKEQQRGAKGQLHKSRAYIEFECEPLYFNADEEGIAKTAAVAIAHAITDSLLSGKYPDGSPLPAADQATIERREYRDVQAGLGGKAPRWANPIAQTKSAAAEARRLERQHQKDTKSSSLELHRNVLAARRTSDRSKARFQAKAQKSSKNYWRRFRAPSLGKFDPRTFSNNVAGLESGMTARSVLVAPEGRGMSSVGGRSGGVWRVYFANPRGIPDRTGVAPVERMINKLGGMGRFWNQGAMMQPGVQNALKKVANALVTHRAIKSLQNLASELSTTAQNVNRLAETAAEDSED